MAKADFQRMAQRIREELDAADHEITSISEDDLQVLITAMAKAIQQELDSTADALRLNIRQVAAHERALRMTTPRPR